MAEYKHGEMDIKTQEDMFGAFMTFTTRAVIIILALLVFLAIFTT